MAKETEKRLIRTLEFLKEPQGSTIPTIVKTMNGEGPQLSLKRIVQTLRGCLENGLLKVSDGRVKLRQVSFVEDANLEDDNQYLDPCDKSENECTNHFCLNKRLCTTRAPINGYSKKSARSCPKGVTITNADMGENNNIPNDEGEAEGEGGGEGGGNCPPCPKCPKKKKKKRCPKKKPKCPRPKRKPKCPKPKKKRPKRCPKKKIQPYCKKKKKCA